MNIAKQSLLKGICAAIIDLDGTMLHTAPDFHVAINRMRAELDLPSLEMATVTDLVGKGTENLIQRVLGIDLPVEEVGSRFAKALASYQRHYAEINGKYVTMYPGVREGLDALQAKGLHLACVTNKPMAFTIPLLEKVDLRRYFEVIYGGDSLPKKKPDPYPFLQVCQDFEISPSQAVAVGDSSNDARAARAAGCHVLNVPYGYNHGQPIQEVDSDGIVSTLLDAANLIST